MSSLVADYGSSSSGSEDESESEQDASFGSDFFVYNRLWHSLLSLMVKNHLQRWKE